MFSPGKASDIGIYLKENITRYKQIKLQWLNVTKDILKYKYRKVKMFSLDIFLFCVYCFGKILSFNELL